MVKRSSSAEVGYLGNTLLVELAGLEAVQKDVLQRRRRGAAEECVRQQISDDQ
jgi:hypothetical protein